MTLALCFLVACLGTAPSQPLRVSAGQEVLDDTSRRVALLELPWLIAGAVQQPDATDAIFGGVLPLRIVVSRLDIAGGLLLASARVPRTGTHANFVARANLRLTSRLALAWTHFSNGSLWGSGNPAMDALGLSVRLGKS